MQDLEDEGHDEDVGGEGEQPTSFRDLLGPECVIRRVDKDKKFLSTAKPEEMQKELMSRAATQKRLGACAEHVKNMNRDEKLRWAIELKDQANQFYNNQNFEEAARLYNDCLVALDLDGDPEENREVQLKLQLPVCTNLAACTIEMARYQQCIEICNIAIDVDPKCAKALYRRGLAHYRLGDHVSARPDFEAALREARTTREEMEYGEEPRALDDLIRRVTVYLGNIRQYSHKERERCQKMWTKTMYDDRPDPKEEAPALVVDDSDEAIEAALAEARGDCCWCCSRRRRHRQDTGGDGDSMETLKPKDKNI
mmetsp:Transcript_51676/g.82110  ORF Transcript_51676/g.82110 Transcript_51676/m.82110 type:complete len:311 (+) Transcript_51676:108-1040(+)